MHIVSLHCFGVNAWVQERTEPITYPQILPPWNKWQRRLKGIWIIQIYQKHLLKWRWWFFYHKQLSHFLLLVTSTNKQFLIRNVMLL